MKMPQLATPAKSSKLEKIDLDRSQLASILSTIHERNRLRNAGKKSAKPLTLFTPTTRGNRSNTVPLVEKLATRVYFADRVKYGEGERVGRASFEKKQPFQLPRIESQQTYKYEQTLWRNFSQDISFPLQVTQDFHSLPRKISPRRPATQETPSLTTLYKSSLASRKKSTPFVFPSKFSALSKDCPPLPPHKKHTLNTIQRECILQDLNLFDTPAQEREETKVPKTILNVDPDFFSVIHGRKIRSKFEPNYVATVRRVLLTKLRIGVIKDEITKVKSKFFKDNKVVEITRDRLTQDYIKYERFVRNDYKQVMQMENRYRLSEQRLTIAQQDHEAAHNDYYDVRISLFELDEAWTQAKLCKNFVNLMTSLNQVKDDEEKLVLINKVNAMNEMNVSNTLEDIVENFKRDLETIKREVEEKKMTNVYTRDKKKLLKRITTEYDIYEDDLDGSGVPQETDDGNDNEDDEVKGSIQQHTPEQKTEQDKMDGAAVTITESEDLTATETVDGKVTVFEESEDNTKEILDKDTKDISETSEMDEKSGQTEEEDHFTKGTEEITDEIKDPIEEKDDSEDFDEEFIKLIVKDDANLVKDTPSKEIVYVKPITDEQFTEELGFDLADIENEDDLESLDKISTILEKLDEDNMNVLLQKENVQDKLEQCSKMSEFSNTYFASKTQQLAQTVQKLEEQVDTLEGDIEILRGDIKKNYDAHVKNVCSNKNNLVLEVLIADLYERCIDKHPSTTSTFSLLTQFQDSLQELRSRIAVLPLIIAAKATGFVQTNMAAQSLTAAAAQRKLAELSQFVTRLNRNLAPPKQKIGKPLRPRSQPFI